MKMTRACPKDLEGVFAVAPLARWAGAGRSRALAANDPLVRHMARGGLTRFLYSGNAFQYHATLAPAGRSLPCVETERRAASSSAPPLTPA